LTQIPSYCFPVRLLKSRSPRSNKNPASAAGLLYLHEAHAHYTNMVTGFSMYFLNVCKKLAPTAPSTLL
jgi:hypothetical protein